MGDAIAFAGADGTPVDPRVAHVTVTASLVCGRQLSDVEIVIVMADVDAIATDILIESLRRIRRTETRVFNLVAAIFAEAAIVKREAKEAAELRHQAAEPPPDHERCRRTLDEIRARLEAQDKMVGDR